MAKRRTPSPSPTVTLDVSSKSDLIRSSSEESIRVLHHAVIFPNSPHLGRVAYIRRSYETDAELIRRQQVAIALQPLTFAEELAVKRKHLEIKAEKRKQEKAAQIAGKSKNIVPEINVAPPSGKSNSVPAPVPAKLQSKAKPRITLKERAAQRNEKTVLQQKVNTDSTKDGGKLMIEASSTSPATVISELGSLGRTTNNGHLSPNPPKK